MSTKRSDIENRIQQGGLLKITDAQTLGVSKRYLYKLKAQGVIEQAAKGLFSQKDWTGSVEHSSIIEATMQVRESTVSLLSALSVHSITTQLPHEVWLTVPRGTWRPKVEYPPVHYTVVNDQQYSYGRQTHQIGASSFHIYSVARTVADCFKFRSKVGLDVAIEALREALRSKKTTIDEITEAAKVCRVLRVMKPYMESVL